MKSSRRWLTVLAVCTSLVVHASIASAQTRTTTGGTSGFGNSAGGLSGSNAFGGGTNRFSSSAANANTAGANQSVLLNQQSSFGMQNAGTSQNGFLGGRNTQTFLGSNQRNGQNNQQQQNQFGNRNNRGRQNQQDFNDFNQQQQMGANQDSRRAIRPQQKVAFDVPRRDTVEITTTLRGRFEKLNQNQSLRSVSTELDDSGVVTLRGTVQTKSARLLAANMARLEPGVKKVINEIDVQADATKE